MYTSVITSWFFLGTLLSRGDIFIWFLCACFILDAPVLNFKSSDVEVPVGCSELRAMLIIVRMAS